MSYSLHNAYLEADIADSGLRGAMLPGTQALAAFGTHPEHGFLHNCGAAPAQRGLINMYDLANTGDVAFQSGYSEVVSNLVHTFGEAFVPML